jgi:hypothetical protein
MSFVFPTNADGSLRAYTAAEVAAFELLAVNVRTGAHPTHTREYGQSTIRATYFCNPTYFDAVCCYLFGAAVTYTAAGDGNVHLSRLMPQTYPDYPAFAATKLERAAGHQPVGETDDPAGLALPLPEYSRLRLDVLFEHVPFELVPDADVTGFDETQRYLQPLPAKMDTASISYHGGILRYLRPDGGSGRPNEQQVQGNVGFPEVRGEVARKWVRVPFGAWSAVDPDTGSPSALWTRVYGSGGAAPFTGTVNKDSLFGYPAGTLLFLGVDEELKRDQVAQGWCWDLTFKWLFKPRRHNFYYYCDPPSPAAGFADASGYYFAGRGTTYYAPGSLPAGVALFDEQDHSKLFQLY